MRHHAGMLVALAAMVTVSALAGPAIAASGDFPGPGASAKDKQQAYGRYCGTEGKRGKAPKAKERRACLNAMARLASGASSPSAVCRALKPKRSKGHKGSSAAYKRCLKAAKKLNKDRLAAQAKAELIEEEKAAELEQDAEALPLPPGALPDLPGLDDDPVEEFDEEEEA